MRNHASGVRLSVYATHRTDSRSARKASNRDRGSAARRRLLAQRGTRLVGIDSGHDSRMIVSSTCYQRPSYGLPLLVDSPLGLVPTALPWEWPVLALMATYCLFLARARIGSESARRRWVGGNWCASQPSPPWCFLMAMAAVGGLEGSLGRVLGQRKASSCSRMCCNHYTAPLGTPVDAGTTRPGMR